MKLKDARTGVVIDAAEAAVPSLLAHGFKRIEAEPKKATKPKRKKA